MKTQTQQALVYLQKHDPGNALNPVGAGINSHNSASLQQIASQQFSSLRRGAKQLPPKASSKVEGIQLPPIPLHGGSGKPKDSRKMPPSPAGLRASGLDMPPMLSKSQSIQHEQENGISIGQEKSKEVASPGADGGRDEQNYKQLTKQPSVRRRRQTSQIQKPTRDSKGQQYWSPQVQQSPEVAAYRSSQGESDPMYQSSKHQKSIKLSAGHHGSTSKKVFEAYRGQQNQRSPLSNKDMNELLQASNPRHEGQGLEILDEDQAGERPVKQIVDHKQKNLERLEALKAKKAQEQKEMEDQREKTKRR